VRQLPTFARDERRPTFLGRHAAAPQEHGVDVAPFSVIHVLIRNVPLGGSLVVTMKIPWSNAARKLPLLGCTPSTNGSSRHLKLLSDPQLHLSPNILGP